MSKGMRILALVAAVIGAGTTMALGQTIELRSSNQVPGLLGQTSNEVTITNMDDSKVAKIFYLDTAWNPIELSPLTTKTFKADPKGLRVNFDDGKESQLMILDTGGRYAIVKNDSGRWVIKPYADVVGGGTGLRSR
jgi:hypothetical protein